MVTGSDRYYGTGQEPKDSPRAAVRHAAPRIPVHAHGGPVSTRSLRPHHWRFRLRRVPSRRGQSLVEFALVLPMLLVLLLGVADFGRVFQAGITLEAATRDAAEVGAIQRLRDKPPPDPAQQPAYYTSLHRLIAQTACNEAELLLISPDQADATACPHLAAIRACIHDDLDTECGKPIPGFNGAAPPPSCTETNSATAPPWTSDSGGDAGSHWVEVRTCYRFMTLFNLHLALPFNAGLNLGDVFLQRTRSFVVDCPPPPVPVTSC